MDNKNVLLLLILCAPLAAHAGFQEFTVHFKVEPKGDSRQTVPHEMIYSMDGTKMRQDTISSGGRAAIILELDGDRLVSTMLDMDEKTYMRTTGKADPQSRILFELPKGDESPCKNDPEAECKRLGTGRIKGYRIIKWQIKERDGKPTVYWYAPRLGFFLKSESDDMVMTATRIEDRAPPAGWFEPPAGFREISYGDFLSGQAAAMPSFKDDMASGTDEPGEPEEDDNMDETDVSSRDAGANPIGDAVTEELKDAFKSLFGK